MYSRKNKKMVKGFKDYLAPIIGWVIFLFFLYSIFSGGAEEVVPTSQNPVIVEKNDATTQAYIEYSGWRRSEVETSNVSLYPWEKVNISTVWNAKITLNETSYLNLNKLWSLLYSTENTFTLYSSDLFVNVSGNTQFDLRYMQVNTTGENQVFNLSQNEVASTIYVLNGSVQVKNTAWVSVMVSKGERLSIVRNDASNKDIDLNSKKDMIDEYIKTDEWYLLNNWDSFLNISLTNDTASWETLDEERPVAWGFWYVEFDLLDESDVTTDIIDITGEFLDDIVYKVEVNGQSAEMNMIDKTFLVKWLKLTSRVNDIVYRVFDESNKLLDKGVITLYYSNAPATATSGTNAAWLATVQNYSLSVSPLYTIVAPKSNPYITTENNVRIEGTVPARTVEKIVVNDFQLQRFPAYGTYWYYFANAEFGNLKEWLNIYKIQYFWAENKLLYENTFTIVKEAPKAPVVVTPPVVEVEEPVIEEIPEETQQ